MARDEIDVILARARGGDECGSVARASSPCSTGWKPVARGRTRGFCERARQRRGGWTLSLNLTPMIDTVFNLLFLFMIISRFGAIEGLVEVIGYRDGTPSLCIRRFHPADAKSALF